MAGWAWIFHASGSAPPTLKSGVVKYASESETGKRAENEHETEGSC
jgi:hypothetical protein